MVEVGALPRLTSSPPDDVGKENEANGRCKNKDVTPKKEAAIPKTKRGRARRMPALTPDPKDNNAPVLLPTPHW